MREAPYIVAGFSDADMIWLLSMGSLRTLKPAEMLVERGRAVTDLFFVMRGALAVQLADGRIVATLTEGDVVGEMSFVEQHPPSTTVKATDRAEVLGIPRGVILERFDREPAFAARFYRGIGVFLSDRLRQTTAALHGAEADHPAPAAVAAAGDRFRRLTRLLGGRGG